MKKQESFITEKESGVVYSLVSVLPYLIMFLVVLALMFIDKDYANKTYYTYISYLTPLVASFGVLTYVCVRKKSNPLAVCSVKKCNPIYILIGVTLIIGLLFGVGYFNELFVGVLEKAGLKFNTPNLPNANAMQLVLNILIIGVLAPTLEELVFRGVILNGLKGLKTYQTVLLCGVLFALFHQNPAQLIYQAIVGGCLTYLTLKAGSVVPSVVAHLVNNIFIIITSVYFSGVEFYNAVTITVGVALFALSLIGIYLLSKKNKTPAQNGTPFNKRGYYMSVVVGVVFNIVLIVSTLFI